MGERFKGMALEKQLFFSFFSLAAVLLLLFAGTTLWLDISRQRKALDQTISNAAAYVASLRPVAEMLERGYPDPQVLEDLDVLCESISGLDSILVCDGNGMRFCQTSRQTGGETELNGDEAAVLQGRGSYITTGYSTLGEQRRAFQAVYGPEGQLLGFVMTSIFTSDILRWTYTLAGWSLLLLAGMLLAALALTRWMVSLLKTSLRGHHPTELLDLYLRQADVLNAIEDGVVATDAEGRIVFSNQAAQGLLQQSGAALTGQALSRFFPDTRCRAVAQGTEAGSDNRSCVLGNRQVLTTELPIQWETGHDGALTVFHDKTEMLALSDKLSGTQNTLDTLRAFNHEFMNKLHVILGYLQSGQIDQAKRLIINSSLVSSQAIRETADCIRVASICALIIGKMMHAAEYGICLTVTPDSRCRPEDLLLSETEYTSIVGNLLENAIEELARSNPKVREIRLGLYTRSDCTIIFCEDSGDGVPEDIRERIFEQGFSSKGTGRGLGLAIVRDITARHGGTIDLETEPHIGTCFTLTFTKERS